MTKKKTSRHERSEVLLEPVRKQIEILNKKWKGKKLFWVIQGYNEKNQLEVKIGERDLEADDRALKEWELRQEENEKKNKETKRQARKRLGLTENKKEKKEKKSKKDNATLDKFFIEK